MSQLFVVSYHGLISFLFQVLGGKFGVQSSDAEVVSVIHLVKMRLGTFTPCSACYD